MPLGHALNQIGPQAGEAELASSQAETLVGGAAALTGAADLR